MQFRIPPGSLSYLSVMWMIGGGIMAYDSFHRGNNLLNVVCVLLIVASILIWFNVRAVAWPLMIWFGIVILLGGLLLFVKEFEWKRLITLVTAVFTIWELYEWRYKDE